MRDFENKEIGKVYGLSLFIEDYCHKLWVLPLINAHKRGHDVEHLFKLEEELYDALSNKIDALESAMHREYVYDNSTLSAPPISEYLLKQYNQLSDEIDIYKDYCDKKADEYEEKYK